MTVVHMGLFHVSRKTLGEAHSITSSAAASMSSSHEVAGNRSLESMPGARHSSSCNARQRYARQRGGAHIPAGIRNAAIQGATADGFPNQARPHHDPSDRGAGNPV